MVKKLDCELCEVAREIQPVRNERTVLPTLENVNDWISRREIVALPKGKTLPRVRTRAAATVL